MSLEARVTALAAAAFVALWAVLGLAQHRQAQQAEAQAQSWLLQAQREAWLRLQSLPGAAGSFPPDTPSPGEDSRGPGAATAPLLAQMAEAFQADAFLVNARGREQAGTAPGLLAREALVPRVDAAHVSEHPASGGRVLQMTVQPLLHEGASGRGALVLVRDLTERRQAEAASRGAQAGAAALLGLTLVAAVHAGTRRMLRPVQRAAAGLEALARGDPQGAPAVAADETLSGACGRIARAASGLRGELLQLQSLREERTRARREQARIIRRELLLLADNIDGAARAEIVQALEAVPAEEAAGADVLAQLSRILGRLSALVSQQHGQLVMLVGQLQQSVSRQALLAGLQQELEIARRMQRSILPQHAPRSPEVDICALMEPASEIGGDFYDYFLIDEDRLALAVADVSGKGIPAAFFMAVSRTLLRSHALILRDPARVIAQLNAQLAAENEQMMFVTLFFCVLHLRSGVLDFVNAGHNPPVIRAASGPVRMLPRNQNMALGVSEQMRPKSGRVVLRPGDTLLLYTDGIVEANDPPGRMFGEQRLLDVVMRHPPGAAGLPQAVLRAVRSFEAGRAQADDITCVAVRYRAQG